MAESAIDYYKILSVASNASDSDIKLSYRKLSLRYHPDRGGSAHAMAMLNEAYRVLSTPHLRRKHDDTLAHVAGEDGFVEIRQESAMQSKVASVKQHATESEAKWSWGWAFALLVLVIGGAQLYANTHAFEKSSVGSSVVEAAGGESEN